MNLSNDETSDICRELSLKFDLHILWIVKKKLLDNQKIFFLIQACQTA